MNLYFVIIKNGDGFWVIAENPNVAYLRLRKVLDEEDLYFTSERELRHIDVIGEEYYDRSIYKEVE